MEELNTKTHCSFQRQNWIQRLKIPWNLRDIRLNTSSPVLDPHIELCWRFCKLFPKPPWKMGVDVTLRLPPGQKTGNPQHAIWWLISCRVLELNSGIVPEQLHEAKTEEEDWGEVVVGQPVARIPPLLSYNIHFPFRRGDLNLHPGVGGSLSSVMLDLQVIRNQTFQRRKIFTPEIAGHLGGCHPKRTRHWPYRPA